MEGCFVNSYPRITSGGLFLSKNLKAIHKEIPLNLLALRSFVKDSTSGQALACTFRAVARYATLNRACPCVWRNVGMVVCLLLIALFLSWDYVAIKVVLPQKPWQSPPWQPHNHMIFVLWAVSNHPKPHKGEITTCKSNKSISAWVNPYNPLKPTFSR